MCQSGLNQIIMEVLNNTFIGTSLAGVVTAYFGVHVYYKKKKIDREIEEIRELNNKIQDRLAEISEVLKMNTKPERPAEVRQRLRYGSFRLKKYDRTLSNDIDHLLELLSDNEEGGFSVGKVSNLSETHKVIERISDKLDKIW